MKRPTGSSVLTPFLRKLAENANAHGEGKLAETIADVLLARLLSGEDVSGILKALDRTDGAVKAQIEHSTAPPIPPLRIEGASDAELAEIRRLANGELPRWGEPAPVPIVRDPNGTD